MVQRIVLVPLQGLPKKFLLVMGVLLVTMGLVIISLLEAAYASALRRSLPFTFPGDSVTPILIMTLFVTLLTCIVALISANQELIWAHDTQKSEIRLEDWYYGTPVFTRRYPIKDVAGIRVWWQRTHSGGGRPATENSGWWKASLVLWNGKSIHLHGERGGPEHPPVDWLARFEHACRVSGVELNRKPVSPRTEQKTPADAPTASIIGKMKRGG